MPKLDQDVLENYLPDGPITSLRRIQVLYGALTEASEGDAGGEFGLYFTPGELEEFTTDSDDDRYLVTAKVDLTGSDAQLVGVDVELFRPSQIEKLGFARYPWGRGIDHSITRRGAKGGSTEETAVKYCLDCLARWTNATGREPAIGRAADSHPDGWVIRSLGELGIHDDIEETLTSFLSTSYPPEKPRVTATVAVKLDPDSLKQAPSGKPEDGFYYPGQLHVLNAGMKARKDQKLATKNLNDSDEPSRGESACMVTGEREEVFGTAEDPLAFFTVQHAEKFASFSRSESWRSHPVSANAALLLQSGSSLLANCSTTRDGRRIYTLPYVIDCDLEDANQLYRLITSDAVGVAQIQYRAEERDPELAKRLRYYIITVRNDSGDINVLFEEPTVTAYWPLKVAQSHVNTVSRESSTLFHPVAGFRGLWEDDEWRGLGENVQTDPMVQWITDGSYARDTLSYSMSDDPTSDDPREWLTAAMLTGQPVPAERLLSEYTERIAAGTDTGEGQFPKYLVYLQFAQLETLARAGLLESSEHTAGLAVPTEMTTENTNKTADLAVPDGGAIALPAIEEVAPNGKVTLLDARRYRLERFIQERQELNSDERRSAFLTGVLLGQLSDHQRREREMNQTLRDQYPSHQMSSKRLSRLVPTLIDKSGVYANDFGQEQLFPETEKQLTETIAEYPPSRDEWKISVADLRFFYALGLAYGADARSQAWSLMRELGVLEDKEQTEETEETP